MGERRYVISQIIVALLTFLSWYFVAHNSKSRFLVFAYEMRMEMDAHVERSVTIPSDFGQSPARTNDP